MSWTPDRIKKLKKHWLLGKSAANIAKELGVSKNAVIGKLHRMNLSEKKAPVVEKEEETIQVKKQPKGKVTLLDLRLNSCRWPIGEPDDPDFHFCGKEVLHGKPYCSKHSAMAYTNVKDPEIDDNITADEIEAFSVVGENPESFEEFPSLVKDMEEMKKNLDKEIVENKSEDKKVKEVIKKDVKSKKGKESVKKEVKPKKEKVEKSVKKTPQKQSKDLVKPKKSQSKVLQKEEKIIKEAPKKEVVKKSYVKPDEKEKKITPLKEKAVSKKDPVAPKKNAEVKKSSKKVLSKGKESVKKLDKQPIKTVEKQQGSRFGSLLAKITGKKK